MSDKACACTKCDMHDICRGAAEPGKKRCMICAVEHKVEKRWQKMLAKEKKQ